MIETENIASPSSFGIRVRDDIAGKRYLNLLRCSGDKQVGTSPEGQKYYNDSFAMMNRLVWAGEDFFAEAVSGSQTFNRDDLEDILRRKRDRNDFEIVVVYEYGRVTRGGIPHGNNVESELRRAGIELISATECIPQGPIGELVKSVKHFANQQQSMNLSSAVARKISQKREEGKDTTNSRTPFGCDRLHVSPAGKETMLIRYEGLVQIWLDPSTKQEIGRAEREPKRPARKKGEKRQKRAAFRGYRKQHGDIVVFVPGESSAVETVRLIYRLFHVDGWGTFRIVQHLRKLDLPAPSGCGWYISVVRNILQNPIYCGIELNGRWTRSIYNRAGLKGPVPVQINQDALQAEGRLCVPKRENPRSEWRLEERPRMKDFLPEKLCLQAREYLEAVHHEDQFTSREATRAARKHKADENPHLLSGILRSKQTQNPMLGSTKTLNKGSSKEEKFRWYQDCKPRQHGVTGTLSRSVPAVPLEDAVIPEIMSVLADERWIEARLRAALLSTEASVPTAGDVKRVLSEERDRLTRRLARIHKTSDGLSDEELAVLVRDDNERLVAIRHELADAERSTRTRPPSVDDAVAAVRGRLRALPSNWRSLPNREMKGLLRSLIGKCEIDLETFEVNLALHVPPSVMQAEALTVGDMPVSFGMARHEQSDYHVAGAVKIEEIRCERDRATRCFTCRRSSKAA